MTANPDGVRLLADALRTAFRRFGGLPALIRSPDGIEKIISICAKEAAALRAAPVPQCDAEYVASLERIAEIIRGETRLTADGTIYNSTDVAKKIIAYAAPARCDAGNVGLKLPSEAWFRKKISSDPDLENDAGRSHPEAPRFFIDHGMIHD